MRTMRQARSLAEAGHEVVIVGFRTPDARLADGRPTGRLIATRAPLPPALVLTRMWLAGTVLRNGAAERREAEAAVAAGRSRNGAFARRAARLLSDRSFDVVQAHFDKSLIAASRIAERDGAKLVFDAVEVPFDRELLPKAHLNRTLRLAEIERESAIAGASDAWITVNDLIADNIVERFGVARPLVLRNFQQGGYRPSDGRLRRDLGLGEDVRILLHLNTMRGGEGLETAIDALTQLPGEFHIVALGPMTQRGYIKAIRQRAAARGVAARFHTARMQPPYAVPPYIAGADIGIIAREGGLQNLRLSLPNRLFQLISARLPVVATALPEISRVIRDWNAGLVFEQGDAAGMAAAIRRIARPEAMARYRQAAAAAALELSWERESEKYVSLIETVARGADDRISAPDAAVIG